MTDENQLLDPAEIGIAAYELVTQVIIELGWDHEKRRAVYERAARVLEVNRPTAAEAIRRISASAMKG